jgi:hypothetical protein
MPSSSGTSDDSHGKAEKQWLTILPPNNRSKVLNSSNSIVGQLGAGNDRIVATVAAKTPSLPALLVLLLIVCVQH